MRPILLLIFSLIGSLLSAQIVDITEFSQNIALQDTLKKHLLPEQQQAASYPSVSETYQLPSYDLYDKYWDVEHLRSRIINIPFMEDRLMLILVQSANNPFEVPCVFHDISLSYGFTKKGIFHPGIDLKVEPQTLVKSCFDGVVRLAKYYGDYGLTVVVRHYNGLETVYAHLDKLCVKPGQIVNAGNVIGQTGNTGNAKETTFHFETRFLNEYFNPELIIDFQNETLVKNTLVLTPADFRICALHQVQSIEAPTKPAPLAPAATPSTENLQKAFDGEELYHFVQAGESLYRIAQKYHTTTAELMRLNNISDADKITVGQRLQVR